MDDRTPTPFRLRRLAAADVLPCVTLGRAAYAALGRGPAPAAATLEQLLRDMLRLFPDECFVAESDGTVHGFILCSSLAGVRATVEEFAVAPASQGQGVGTALLGHVLSRCRQRGVTHVELVADRCTPAYGFYHRHGFRESPDYCLMSLTL